MSDVTHIYKFIVLIRLIK